MAKQPPKDYWDKELIAQKREMLKLLREILEYTADERDFVEAVKIAIPNVTSERLKELITLFHASVAEKRGGGPAKK